MSSDFGNDDVQRQVTFGLDWAMAGAASARRRGGADAGDAGLPDE